MPARKPNLPAVRLLPVILVATACADSSLRDPVAPGRGSADVRAGAIVVAAAAAPATILSDEFDALDPSLWSVEEHPLGRGWFRRANVSVQGGAALLAYPPASYDGGEIRSVQRYAYGTYEARLKTPFAPGTIAAFFLYQGVSTRNDEIDIELFNDGSRRVMFTTWVADRQTHNVTMTLPFDPSAGFHDYRIEWSSNRVRFVVDGVLFQQWTNKLPRNPMFVMTNAWWPTWLTGPTLPAAATLEIDRIQISN